jgi:Flp pilus assembly protein TadG
MNNIKKTRKHQSGQALILIVFAIIGLIGLTALTIDGGNAYSDRRHAQNASDTAALAAARAKIRQEDWKQAALDLAAFNGYVDSDHTDASSSTLVNVEVYQCDESGIECNVTLKAGDTLKDYLQVRITSTVQTYFGRVLGIQQMTNHVSSIVRVKDGTKQPIGNGTRSSPSTMRIAKPLNIREPLTST